ncbi:MAG: DUF2066 domain-containing protein [Gammaproteobacteria bacterium]|nr:DUF2066 domain-containing protein [Gammaproteobacteria bacterium]
MSGIEKLETPVVPKRLNILVFISLLAPLLLASPALGAAPLGTVSIPVADQSRGEREAAVREAMQVVVLRLTGREGYLEMPEVEAVLRQSNRFLQQFSYQSIAPIEVERDGKQVELPLSLQVRFDVNAVQAALQGRGVPLWARERPRTQVWLALSTGSGRQLVRSERTVIDDQNPVDSLRRAAAYRGVPVELPAASGAAGRVGFEDVWSVYDQPLRQAAESAGANNALAVSLFAQSGSRNWVGRFTLLTREGDSLYWESTGEDLDAVLAAGIGELAERYATEFSVVSSFGGGGTVKLEIEGVTTLEEYGRVSSYLTSLSAVSAIGPVKVGGDSLLFEIELTGSSRALQRAISLGSMLVEVSRDEVFSLGVPSLETAEDPVLKYRLR